MIAHITVHSELAVTRIANYCDELHIEYYVAPKLESSDRNPAERVVVTADAIQLGL